MCACFATIVHLAFVGLAPPLSVNPVNPVCSKPAATSNSRLRSACCVLLLLAAPPALACKGVQSACNELAADTPASMPACVPPLTSKRTGKPRHWPSELLPCMELCLDGLALCRWWHRRRHTRDYAHGTCSIHVMRHQVVGGHVMNACTALVLLVFN